MASVNDIGAITDPLNAPLFGGATGWADAVRKALNGSDVTVDARIAAHAGAADPHPGYLLTAEGDARYEAAGAIAAHVGAGDPHTQYVEKAGDTLTGPLVLAADPAVALGAATKQYVDNSMPVGVILAYGGTVAPAGWHLCDGSVHGSSALQALIGTTTTPDLRARFIVGTGSGYAQKDVGGAAAVTLSAAQSGLPGHAHTASSAGETQEHTHGIDPPYTGTGTVSADHAHGFETGWMNHNNPHAHDGYTKEGITTGDSDTWIDTADADGTARWNTMEISAIDINHTHSGGTGGINANHYHGVDIGAFGSGGRSAVHTHAITVDAVAAAGASASHENRPPYYALTYIIKK